jgi:carboxyl-terminal processing protease
MFSFAAYLRPSTPSERIFMNQYSRGFRFLQVVLCTGAIATTATLSSLSSGWNRSVLAALEDSPKTVLDEAWQIVNQKYVDPDFNQVDWQAIRVSLLNAEYSSTEQAYAALREALGELGDRYTRFLDPDQYQALSNQTAGELSGVGMTLTLDETQSRIMVVEPMENSPAMLAGIESGDQILEIDGQSTDNMTVGQAAELIRGEVGSQIKLQIARPGVEPFEVTLTRARIALPAVDYSLKQEGANQVGYIRLKEFSSHAAEQMRSAINDLSQQNVQGFVLDLRGNPGGLLYASIDIAQMWLNDGDIVHTVDRNGFSDDFLAHGQALTNLPLAVLVDNNSASASEILAGALQDNGRATIIGGQTFGKALVQSVHKLSDGSGLAVTIAHYYTPNGTDISHKGITPDIQVDMNSAAQVRASADGSLLGTEQDPCYVQAVSNLQAQIRPQPFAIQDSTY